MKKDFSVITRLSLMSMTLVGLVMLVLMLLVDDVLQRFQQEAAASDRRNQTALVRAQTEQDAEIILSSLRTTISEELHNNDLSRLQLTLLQLVRSPRIDYIYLFDNQDRILLSGQQDGAAVHRFLPPEVPRENPNYSYWQDQQLHLSEAISYQGQPIGGLALAMNFSSALAEAATRASADTLQQSALLNDVHKSLLIIFIILMPVSMLSTRWLTYRLLRPLQNLTASSIRYAQGDRDVSFELPRQDEIGRLGSALEQMRIALEQSHHLVQTQALEDVVTGLNNRRWFQQRLQEFLTRSASIRGRFAVLLIDLDHFKQINDTAGHERGDQLLREVTERLQQTLLHLRHNHQPHTTPTLARLGGDEFVVLLPTIDSADDAANMARQLSTALAEPFILSGQYFSISCSIGITLYPDDGLTSSEILKHADLAMYSAKQHGRNQFAFFHARMTEEAHERLQIQQGMREALEQGQLFLDYQPIYDLNSNRPIGAEALVRWQHPEQGLISPARFIPIIEESDLIEDVTRWVAAQATRDLQRFLQQDAQFTLSINVSGAALHMESICQYICELKHERKLPDHSLCIEITETSMIQHLERSEQMLQIWKRQGIDIWIDDFGTGYSSLAYLNSLEIQGLKIDRSFVVALAEGHSKPLINAIIALAKSLQLETVAEGIETTEQWNTLQQMGVDYGQGFGLARPMRAAALLELLTSNLEESLSHS